MCRQRNTCNRKPCMHDNGGYRTSVKATGKFCFPFLFFASPFIYLPWRITPYHFVSLFLFASPPVCLRSHAAFRTASACHFRCWGKGNFGIVRGCKIKPPWRLSGKISTLTSSGSIFCPTNLASPNPYLSRSPRNENDRCGRRRHKETTDIRRGEKKKDSTQLSQSERNKLQFKKFKI